MVSKAYAKLRRGEQNITFLSAVFGVSPVISECVSTVGDVSPVFCVCVSTVGDVSPVICVCVSTVGGVSPVISHVCPQSVVWPLLLPMCVRSQ